MLYMQISENIKHPNWIKMQFFYCNQKILLSERMFWTWMSY